MNDRPLELVHELQRQAGRGLEQAASNLREALRALQEAEVQVHAYHSMLIGGPEEERTRRQPAPPYQHGTRSGGEEPGRQRNGPAQALAKRG
jgi:hypothetical protein